MSDNFVEQMAGAAEAAGLDVEALVGQAAGAVIFGMVRAFVDAGVPVTKALRLAAFLVLDGSAGRGAVESIGMSERAARRTRAEIRDVMAGVELSEEIPPSYVSEWAAAMADRQRWAAKDQGE